MELERHFFVVTYDVYEFDEQIWEAIAFHSKQVKTS